MKTYTVDLGFAAYNAATVHVEAENAEAAITQAMQADCDWRSIDHCGDTFVWDIAEGDHPCAALAPTDEAVPVRYQEASRNIRLPGVAVDEDTDIAVVNHVTQYVKPHGMHDTIAQLPVVKTDKGYLVPVWLHVAHGPWEGIK